MPLDYSIKPNREQTNLPTLAGVGALLALGVIRVLTGREQLEKPGEPRGSTDVPTNEESTDD